MPNEKITFSRGPSTSMPTELVPGQFLVQTDTGNMFLDNTTDPSTGRVQIKDSTKVPLDGSVAMTGVLNMNNYINMNNHKIINLATPTNNTDATTKLYVDTEFQALESEFANTIAGYLPLKGGTMDGDIVVPEDNKITLNNTPVADTDAVNKSYVDSTINNAVGDITDFGIDSNGGTGYASLKALQQAHPTGEVGIFYLVTSSDPSTNNAFDEYFWVPDSSGTGGSYEYAGTFGTVDTSTLATKTELQDGLANKLNVNGQSVTGNFAVTTPTGNIQLTAGESSTCSLNMSSNSISLGDGSQQLLIGPGADMDGIELAAGDSSLSITSTTSSFISDEIELRSDNMLLRTQSSTSTSSISITDTDGIQLSWSREGTTGAGTLELNNVTTGVACELNIPGAGFSFNAWSANNSHARIESSSSYALNIGITGSANNWANSPGYISFGQAGGITLITNTSNNGITMMGNYVTMLNAGFVNAPLATDTSSISNQVVTVKYLNTYLGNTTGIDDGVVGS